MILTAGCGRAASARDQRSVPAAAAKVDGVDIRTVGSGLVVQYRTRASIRDCKAQAEEMPQVSDRAVRERRAIFTDLLAFRARVLVISGNTEPARPFAQRSRGRGKRRLPCS